MDNIARTPSFVLELELSLTPHEEAILRKKLNICTQIYNACLREALKRLHKVLADKTYRTTLTEKKSRERTQKLREIEQNHRYTEYQLHSWSKGCYQHFRGAIGSAEVQKLATRAFHAVEQVHYHQAKKVIFKENGQLITVENKTNRQGLRWYDNKVLWGELALDVRIRKNDHYAHEALRSRTKYIRIVPRTIRGRDRFYVQFIQEGLPPSKPNRQPTINEEIIGVYTDATTAAIVSAQHVELVSLSPNTEKEEEKLRRTLQAMERSKRANNPHNYNQQGKVKKGRRTWIKSNRYQKLNAKRKELYRKIRVKRKQSHEELANHILSLGLDIRVPSSTYTETPKDPTQNHSPSTFLLILDRKLHYYGTELSKIDAACLSPEPDQSPNWVQVGDHSIQRNLYQAFLLVHLSSPPADPDLNVLFEAFRSLHDIAIRHLQTQKNNVLIQHIA